MMHAYSEVYLDDAMQNLGDMLDFAVCDCGFQPDEFFDKFISSGVARKFEKGNPKYIAGMSGMELVSEIVFLTEGKRLEITPIVKEYRGCEYWAGWIMAYYQWYRGMRFLDMVESGLGVSEVLSLYILHEADESKFVETADKIMRENKMEKASKLSCIRKARGMTQRELAEASGVSLRMIQLYEQQQNDINKAQARVVMYLARVLGCEMEDLLGW